MGGFPARELDRYNLPDWEQFEQLLRGDGRHFFQEGIGPSPLVMVRSDWVEGQKGLVHWRGVLAPFKKPKAADSEDAETDTEEDEDSPTEVQDLEDDDSESSEAVDAEDEVEVAEEPEENDEQDS
jgi:hypothetical protein